MRHIRVQGNISSFTFVGKCEILKLGYYCKYNLSCAHSLQNIICSKAKPVVRQVIERYDEILLEVEY